MVKTRFGQGLSLGESSRSFAGASDNRNADILMARPTRALSLLRETFGHTAFRGAQQEVVEHVIAGGDALVLMPTGGGKSLCYQIPALLRDGAGIIVSPLIALMQDQVAALTRLGVRGADAEPEAALP